MMSKSQIITDQDIGAPRDWLHNPHAGEMLASEFMEPIGLSVTDLAKALGIAADRLAATLSGERRMDADLSLRLARYYSMSPGFFLALQTDYELLEASRALRGRLNHIQPRTAEAA